MIAAAAAAGITLALGTPIGGVFFSIEVTSSIYLVRNLVKAFSCATLCFFFSNLITTSSSRNMNLFDWEKINSLSGTEDIIFFLILGIICGLISAMLSTIVSKISYIRKKCQIKILKNRFYYAILCIVIISFITFIFKPLMVYDRYMLPFIFNKKLSKNEKFSNHNFDTIELFLLFLFKVLITIISLTMNIPVGIISPFFVIGGFFGRFYNNLISKIFNTTEGNIYAIIGSACVMSGATHSISSAIIIFELTGQTSFIIPMLVSCLFANLTSQAISSSFFDVFLLMKNLPHLPSIKNSNLYNLTAKEIMGREIYSINTKKINVLNSLDLLLNIPKKYGYSIPILDENRIIKYTLKPSKLAKYITNLFEDYKLNYDTEIQNKINNVISFINRKKMGKKFPTFYMHLKHNIKKIFLTRKDKEQIKENKESEIKKLIKDFNFLRDYAKSDEFILQHFIDIEDDTIKSEKSAFTIDVNFTYLKIHFLFTFLNKSHLFVCEDGYLVGIITKEDFVRKSIRYDESQYFHTQ